MKSEMFLVANTPNYKIFEPFEGLVPFNEENEITHIIQEKKTYDIYISVIKLTDDFEGELEIYKVYNKRLVLLTNLDENIDNNLKNLIFKLL